ncbi:acetylornithine deacetylase [Ferrovibrio sp.]|uniref:acetylornithine deacetylase n=1 Tax=Ferrovibrio sp. TaxID=1917215 RepID=UPI0025B9AE56|nr:acetylornithine deacetylase [Ferrovibrio sp.]MBX3456548.1 acetylornithine deacetylase [Ferrovibrio sp.]
MTSQRPSDSALAMIKQLIEMPTVSRDSNLDLIHWIRDHLKGLGVESQLVFDATGKKANLYATLGPTDRPGIVLSGHTDVVPIDGQEWQTDPFKLTEKNGLLYGRGTSDMKSFVALALAHAPQFLAGDLKTPIHYAFTYDEEVGCLGAKRLIEVLREMPIRPAACIVGEPTEMQVIAQHKGKKSWRVDVRGFECHSSLTHQGANAVEAAAEIIAYIKGLARKKKAEGPFDAEFAPPYTSLHTGTVQGGTALNIVPKDCSFLWEIRYLPQDDVMAMYESVVAYARDKIEPELKAIDPGCGCHFHQISEFPGLATDDAAPVVQLAKALTGANRVAKVSFGTEAGLFSELGIPTIVCGPGSIEQAHKPNEFISLEQVALGEAFMGRLLERAREGSTMVV